MVRGEKNVERTFFGPARGKVAFFGIFSLFCTISLILQFLRASSLLSEIFLAAGGVFFGWLSYGYFASLFPGATFLDIDRTGFTVSLAFRSTRINWVETGKFKTSLGLIVFGLKRNGLMMSLNKTLTGVESYIPSVYNGRLLDIVGELNKYRDSYFRGQS